jgi:hypothetical protein
VAGEDMKYAYILFLYGAIISFSAVVQASPDVFFTDSDQAYNGAYLRHRFHNNFTRISFKFDAVIPGVNLRQDSSFNFAKLTHYIENIHQFAHPNLRDEMVRMMSMSFTSRFRASFFLHELTSVLTGYLAQPGGHW